MLTKEKTWLEEEYDFDTGVALFKGMLIKRGVPDRLLEIVDELTCNDIENHRTEMLKNRLEFMTGQSHE